MALSRSKNMSRIRSRDTMPELVVRSVVHRLGFRFRLHRTDLPGTPDLVFPRLHAVIFVHGCFWHRHRGCKRATTPKTRRSFWIQKFEQNQARDERNIRALKRLGWRVIVIWECQCRDVARLERRLRKSLSRPKIV